MNNDPFSEEAAFAAAMPLSQRAMAGGRPVADAEWLRGLNPAQRQAVETLDGPLLVLAGAGTGKTRVLTTRMAHLIAQRKAAPWQILAVTFTNKAAREMKHRIESLLGEGIEAMPWLGTFHSISAKILRRHAELVDLQPNFTILDTDDQLRLLKQLIQAEGIDEKRWPARFLATLIDRWKNRALLPDRIPAAENAGYAFGKGQKLYREYQERLRSLNACDFGDLLLHVLRIFQTRDDILTDYQRRFRYILVDEYQDTNVAQYLWLRLLAAGHRNICCVGDDDQSIYGWRGAEVGNILKFEQDFPGAHIVRLEQNYRSTPHILRAAAKVISGNAERLGKTLWTERQHGDRVRLIGHWDSEEEARWIGDEIEAMGRGSRGHDPVSPDHIAILVRASYQMRAFEDRFLTIGLPYRVIGGPRFYERLEVRDALAYLRVVAQPDDGLALERIINTPKRGLGDKAIQVINQRARADGISLLAAARRIVAEAGLPPKPRKALELLIAQFDRWRAMMLDPNGPGPVELAEMVLDDSGYTGMWQADKSPEAVGRLENLKELVRSLGEFGSIPDFLDHVALVMDNESSGEGEKVNIMTLHAAKGLEFDAVFLPGWEEGLFPSQRSLDESGVKGLEEERRLAYVGITRARRHLTISFAANRRVYHQWQSSLPSRFIDELPPEAVEVLTAPGLYRGGLQHSTESALERAAGSASVYHSPGWARMQANGARRSTVIEGRAKAAHRFEIGARVFHQKFGAGEVMEVDGDKLTVEFDHAGSKSVVASFLTPVGDVPF